MLIFLMQSKIKKNLDFLYNNDIVLEDTLQNILNKIKNEIIPNNKYINMNAANIICQEIKDIICSNIKVFDNSILKCKECDIYDKIIDTIKKDKKINISNICDYDSSIDIFNHLVKIKSSNNKIIIPIEYCTYFSPRDNIYYIIIEYLKNLKPNEEKIHNENIYSYIKLNSIFKFNSKDPHFYKGKILYRDNNHLQQGYINISSTLEEYNYDQEYQYNNTFSNLINGDIIFNIDIYNKNDYNSPIDQISCRYHDNNFTFTSLNNINIYFFGNIFTEAYEYDYYTANEICNNINIFLKYIYNGFIPNLGYFNYVKDTRKNMIRSHSYAYGTVKDNVKYDIELVTSYMKKYRKIMNKYIYQKILLIIWCLEKYNIILPVEVWCIICSKFDIIPNIDIN